MKINSSVKQALVITVVLISIVALGITAIAEVAENRDAVPGKYDVTEAQAIIFAKGVLTEVYGYEEQAADHLIPTAQFIYSPKYFFGEEPIWSVTFTDPESGALLNNVFLAHNGNFVEIAAFDDAMAYRCPLNEEFDELVKERGQFVTWSIEQKAEFTQTWLSKVDDWAAGGNSNERERVRDYIYNLTSFMFLLPRESDISENESLEKAKQAYLAATGLGIDALDDFIYYKSFLLDDSVTFYIPDQEPKWRWFFVPKLQVGDNDYGYRIDIDAKTGETISIVRQVAGFDERNLYLYE